jgi:2-polyprenyl-3-methyl-5-hydroxy-6-metoxy-1,4-benzoquinol methylase
MIESIIPRIPGEISALDIGAGLGRFSIPLAMRNKNIVIDCVEKSNSMAESLKEIIKKKKVSNIKVHCEDFQSYNLEKKYDIVIASEVLHLLASNYEAIKKISKLLKDNGYLFTRMPFSHQLSSGDLYQHFPETLEIDLSRHFTKKNFYRITAENGLFLEEEIKLTEAKTLNGIDYLKIFEDKVYSTLHILEESVYNKRINQLKNTIQIDTTYKHKINMTLTKLKKC